MIKIEKVNQVMWERLAVFKITKYPSKQKEFKPFAQFSLYYKPGVGIGFRIWSFEVKPPLKVINNHNENIFKDSVLSVVLGEKKSNKDGLVITLNKNGNYIIKKLKGEDSNIIKENLQVNCFSGENLQGIYWGVEFTISENILKRYLNINLELEKCVKMNLIKSSENSEYSHCGGFIEVKKNWLENLYIFSL